MASIILGCLLKKLNIFSWIAACAPACVFNPEIEEVEAVEVDDVGRFKTLVNKWKL